jgi:hypothetical protein
MTRTQYTLLAVVSFLLIIELGFVKDVFASSALQAQERYRLCVVYHYGMAPIASYERQNL